MLRTATLAWLFGVATPQLIGVDVCACQPSVVEFQLNLAIACEESNVAGPGILESACIIESRDNPNVVDEVPVSVNSIQILELGGAALAVLDDTSYTDGYVDGDIITYTSIIERSPENITAELIPRGFQVSMNGLNAREQAVTSQWIIIYDNDCGTFPLLTVGQQIGWSVFTELGVPGPQFCPIAGTSEPSVNETEAPTTTTDPSSTPITPSPSLVQTMPDTAGFFTGDNGCAAGNEAGGLIDNPSAQELSWESTNIAFTINGVVIDAETSIILQVEGEYNFAIQGSSDTATFVGGLIRVQQGEVEGLFTFGPLDGEELDSMEATACDLEPSGVAGVIQIESESEKTALSGRFVSFSDEPVVVDVTVVVTGSDDNVVTFAYNQYVLETTSAITEFPVPTPIGGDTPLPSSAVLTLQPTATLSPTITNAPTFEEVCVICGSANLGITLPDALVVINGISAPCRLIAKLADQRLIPPGQACDDTIVGVVETCGCAPLDDNDGEDEDNENATPVPTPIDSETKPTPVPTPIDPETKPGKDKGKDKDKSKDKGKDKGKNKNKGKGKEKGKDKKKGNNDNNKNPGKDKEKGEGKGESTGKGKSAGKKGNDKTKGKKRRLV